MTGMENVKTTADKNLFPLLLANSIKVFLKTAINYSRTISHTLPVPNPLKHSEFRLISE